MPRINPTRCPLVDLIAALVGAPLGDQPVCEFSCSCCRSGASAAADVLCEFLLLGGSEAAAAFRDAGGLQAVQVGLRSSSSSSSTVACAAVRVAGALLQARFIRPQAPPQAVTASSHELLGGQQQHQQQATATATEQPDWLDPDVAVHRHRLQQQQRTATAAPSAQDAATWCQLPHGGDGNAASSRPGTPAGEGPKAAAGCFLAAGLDCADWLELLQSLCAAASAVAGASVAVRVAALQELQQLLLLLAADAEYEVASATAAITSCTPAAADSCGVQGPPPPQKQQQLAAAGMGLGHCSSGSCNCCAPAAWLPDVLQAAVVGISDSHQDVRRAGSQTLAAAVVLQEA